MNEDKPFHDPTSLHFTTSFVFIVLFERPLPSEITHSVFKAIILFRIKKAVWVNPSCAGKDCPSAEAPMKAQYRELAL